MFGSLGPMELMIIFIIVLIVFGADRLPELARGLGKGIREFKRAADEVKNEIMIDPELNLDLNEPLSHETEKIEDPYNTEEWQTSQLETNDSDQRQKEETDTSGDESDKDQVKSDVVQKEKKNRQSGKANKRPSKVRDKSKKSDSDNSSFIG